MKTFFKIQLLNAVFLCHSVLLFNFNQIPFITCFSLPPFYQLYNSYTVLTFPPSHHTFHQYLQLRLCTFYCHARSHTNTHNFNMVEKSKNISKFVANHFFWRILTFYTIIIHINIQYVMLVIPVTLLLSVKILIFLLTPLSTSISRIIF